MTSRYPNAGGIELSEEAVRRRFAHAGRAGNSRWLWPELTIEQWQTALDSIAAVTRDVLAGTERPHLAGQAEALGIAGYTSGMGPILGYWLAKGDITADAEAAGVLETHFTHNRDRMAKLAGHAAEISAGFARKGVHGIVLKGMDTAFACFPDPGARPMSDIDLLVAPDDEAAANEVLAGLGYVAGRANSLPPARNWRRPSSSELPRTLSFVHAEDPWSVDLQTSLNRRAGAHEVELDRCLRRMPLRRSERFPAFHSLPPAALVLHLACHASCTLESLSLLRLLELVLVVRQSRRADPGLWDDVVEIADGSEVLSFTYPAFRLSEALAPGTVPDGVQERCRAAATAVVRRVVDRLSPARAQSQGRCSLEERFMWNRSRLLTARQFLREIVPPGSSSIPALLAIYRNRMRRVAQGTVTR
jgi:hypothetical protein